MTLSGVCEKHLNYLSLPMNDVRNSRSLFSLWNEGRTSRSKKGRLSEGRWGQKQNEKELFKANPSFLSNRYQIAFAVSLSSDQSPDPVWPVVT